jgi:hypothetical protein
MSHHQGPMVSYRRALILTHRRYRAATAAPRPRGREAKGADAPARRLRAALMSYHQGPMVSHGRSESNQRDSNFSPPSTLPSDFALSYARI